MAALLGAVGGAVGSVAGGVLGATSSIVGGVAGGVVSIARIALGPADQLESTHDDEASFHGQRMRIDQVLHFFECEYERYTAFAQDASKLESLRVEYYNCINAIDFQNELIAQLVDELLELRMSARSAEPSSRKDICIRLAHAKLDISDRKNKRFFKEKDRRTLVETLSPLIAEVKMKRLMEEQESEQREVTLAGSSSRVPESEVWGSQMEAHQSAATARRRYKHYSDQELNALLRETDD